MTNEKLVTLYAEHVGKVSDKWSSYFDEYDRILGPYRNKPVRLLEIGIQNGGSLEIWSKYFPHAQKLVGCDINPDCAGLSYEDPRIAVVVGDANSDTAQAEILRCAPAFDVIMEDGSHRSSDIVKAFARYFPHVADDGVFVAEDLHCSYWEECEGGLFAPFSSVTFFKRLADVISHEHWGIDKNRTDILAGFFSRYGFQIDENTLQHVHSVEFINSMCVICKAKPECNRLGARIIVGSVGTVVPGHVLRSSLEEIIPDQTGNVWTARSMPPDEEVLIRIKELSERDRRIASLNQALSDRDEEIVILKDAVTHRDVLRIKELSERDGRIASLNQALSDRDEEIVILNDAVREREGQIASLKDSLKKAVRAYETTISWRVTRPVRMIGRGIKRVKRIVRFTATVLSNPNDMRTIGVKVVRIYGREGLSGVGQRLRLLQSDQYVQERARDRGVSTEVLGELKLFAHVVLQSEEWWLSNDVRRGCSERVLGFLRGEPEAARESAKSVVRFHLDTPRLGRVNIGRGPYHISGWAVDLDACSAVTVRVVVGRRIYETSAVQRQDVQRAFAPVYELPPHTGFAITLALPVGVHRMRIEVERVDGSWSAMRDVLLLRIPGESCAQKAAPQLSYSAWTRLEQKRLKAQIPDIKRDIDAMVQKPTFTVIVDGRQGGAGLEDTIQSIRRQLYPLWDVRVLSGVAGSALPEDMTTLNDTSLSDIQGDFIVFLQSGQRLGWHALYEFAAAINRRPDIDLIYGDEDSVGASGERRNPFHKPGWSPDYLETFNYIGFPACFRAVIARGCFDNGHVYEFVLRFTERTTRALHIPKILGHGVEKLGVNEATLTEAAALDIKALSGRLSRTGRRGSVHEHELHKGCYGIRLQLKRSPLVSVVIPTAGKTVKVGQRQIDLIANVIGHIRERSTYKKIEIIVVDNGDLSASQLRVLAEAECRRITYSHPIVNISTKLNLGVSIATGELLLLLNDDIEILTAGWIERLLEHFEKPHVGVVGAKLLYPSETTQHVGVVHNFGNPDHVRRGFPRSDAGYFFSTCGVRNYCAVTGACMMTPARIYREVGGYSEELAVNFGDVDFCLKVRRKGLSVVYTPGAELIHMESLSRGASFDMRELAWFHRRWAADLVLDEFYNERFLTVEPPTFVPCVNERVR